jgi:S1-C subfamily serine protease
MGLRVLRGNGTRGGAAGVFVIGGLLLLSCTNQGIGPVSTSTAAVAATTPKPPSTDSLADTLDLAGLQDRFAEVAKKVSPAVVAISATEGNFNYETALRSEDLNPDRLAAMLAGSDRTVGTGFIVDRDGYIVTNDHVVAHAEQLWVTTDDRHVYPAIVIGSDPRADIAVIKIPGRNLPTVKWADPANLRRGEWTIAIGNPYGLAAEGEMCMSVGVVSAVGRSLPKLSGKEDRLYSDLIQTSAQINPGNSGGPLFDVSGNVIGINAAVILPQKQTNGIGFAIPANERVFRIIETLKSGGEVVYGYLGVKASTPTERERRAAKIDGDVGALVDSVEDDSPASAGGLKRGDVVINFNGETIRDGEHLIRVVGAAPVDLKGTKATIVRGEKRQTLTVKLRRREIASAAVTRDKQRLRWRGLLLGPIPANWSFPGKKPASTTGVMVLGVGADCPFAKTDGVAQGAVITAIGGKPVAGIVDLQSLHNDLPTEQCSLQIAGQERSTDKSAVATIRE